MTEQLKQIPLLYLDQNILSEIAEGRFHGLFNKIRTGDMQLIYSYVHITETARCSNQEFQSKVVQAVTDMNGAYIHEGQLHFDKSPQLRLDEHFANPVVYSNLVSSMEKFAHKFFGGQQGINFQSLIEAKQKAFAGLMQHLAENIQLLSESKAEEIQNALPGLKLLPDLMQYQFQEAASKLSATLAAIPSPETFDGANEFRTAIEVAPISLNNIHPPNVMQKIWDQASASGKIPSQISSASDFLAKGVWAHIKDGEPTWADKIGSLYNLLNLIGYCPDNKLHKDDKFHSSMGDQTHATFAAFAQILITGDGRMAKKIYAVYEHLGIGTLVCWCKKDTNGRFVLLIGEEIFLQTQP